LGLKVVRFPKQPVEVLTGPPGVRVDDGNVQARQREDLSDAATHVSRTHDCDALHLCLACHG
jgi:hypothetical protein